MPDSIRIRIVTPDSIRYSIRMQMADLQVPKRNRNVFSWDLNVPSESLSVTVLGREFSEMVARLEIGS